MYLAHHKLHSFFTHRSETPYLFITGRVSSFNLTSFKFQPGTLNTHPKAVCVCVCVFVCVCVDMPT